MTLYEIGRQDEIFINKRTGLPVRILEEAKELTHIKIPRSTETTNRDLSSYVAEEHRKNLELRKFNGYIEEAREPVTLPTHMKVQFVKWEPEK